MSRFILGVSIGVALTATPSSPQKPIDCGWVLWRNTTSTIQPAASDPQVRKWTTVDGYDNHAVCRKFMGREIEEIKKNPTAHEFFKDGPIGFDSDLGNGTTLRQVVFFKCFPAGTTPQ